MVPFKPLSNDLYSHCTQIFRSLTMAIKVAGPFSVYIPSSISHVRCNSKLSKIIIEQEEIRILDINIFECANKKLKEPNLMIDFFKPSLKTNKKIIY